MQNLQYTFGGCEQEQEVWGSLPAGIQRVKPYLQEAYIKLLLSGRSASKKAPHRKNALCMH